MLWVLKRTVSMRRFFWAPKTYVKIDGYEEINNFYPEIFCLSKPVYVYLFTSQLIQSLNTFSKHFYWFFKSVTAYDIF